MNKRWRSCHSSGAPDCCAGEKEAPRKIFAERGRRLSEFGCNKHTHLQLHDIDDARNRCSTVLWIFDYRELRNKLPAKEWSPLAHGPCPCRYAAHRALCPEPHRPHACASLDGYGVDTRSRYSALSYKPKLDYMVANWTSLEAHAGTAVRLSWRRQMVRWLNKFR